jgi:hypothetical protein
VSKSTAMDFEANSPLPPVAHIHVHGCLDLWTRNRTALSQGAGDGCVTSRTPQEKHQKY